MSPRRCRCYREGLNYLIVSVVQTVAHLIKLSLMCAVCQLRLFWYATACLDFSSLLHMPSSKGNSSYSRVLAGSWHCRVTTCHLTLGRKRAWYSLSNREHFCMMFGKYTRVHINSTKFNQATSNCTMMIGSLANWVQFLTCLQISNEWRYFPKKCMLLGRRSPQTQPFEGWTASKA